MTDHLAADLSPLLGKRIPGGCPNCDAYQTVYRIEEGHWKMTTHHDDWCPIYIAMGKP